jgi:hypothetical protein
VEAVEGITDSRGMLYLARIDLTLIRSVREGERSPRGRFGFVSIPPARSIAGGPVFGVHYRFVTENDKGLAVFCRKPFD